MTRALAQKSSNLWRSSDIESPLQKKIAEASQADKTKFLSKQPFTDKLKKSTQLKGIQLSKMSAEFSKNDDDQVASLTNFITRNTKSLHSSFNQSSKIRARIQLFFKNTNECLKKLIYFQVLLVHTVRARSLHKRDNNHGDHKHGNHTHEGHTNEDHTNGDHSHNNTTPVEEKLHESEFKTIFDGGRNKLSEDDILLDELNAQIVTGVVSIILGSVLLAVVIVVMTKVYDGFFCSVTENEDCNSKVGKIDEEIEVKPVLGILKLISEMPNVACESDEGENNFDKVVTKIDDVERRESIYSEKPPIQKNRASEKYNPEICEYKADPELYKTTSATQTNHGFETTENSTENSTENTSYDEDDSRSLGDLDDCKIISRHSLKEVMMISTSETFVSDSFEVEHDEDFEDVDEDEEDEDGDGLENGNVDGLEPEDGEESKDDLDDLDDLDDVDDLDGIDDLENLKNRQTRENSQIISNNNSENSEISTDANNKPDADRRDSNTSKISDSSRAETTVSQTSLQQNIQ